MKETRVLTEKEMQQTLAKCLLFKVVKPILLGSDFLGQEVEQSPRSGSVYGKFHD